MAVMVNIHCLRCRQVSEEMVGSGQPAPLICSRCRVEDAAEARRLHMAELAALPLEERITKIEEWIYDFEKRWGGTLHRAQLGQMRF